MAVLQEGGSYTVRATVTNRTTRSGAGAAATLSLEIKVGLPALSELLIDELLSRSFAAGETRVFTNTLNIPAGIGAQTGLAQVRVLAPDGSMVGSAYELLTVEAALPSLASFYGGLMWPPNPPWDYWLAYWWDGGQWVQNPDGWISVGQLARFPNVPVTGSLGFYLWRSDTATTGPFNGPFGPVTAWEGAIVQYNFQTGQVSVN